MNIKKALLGLVVSLAVIAGLLAVTSGPSIAQSSSGEDAAVLSKLDQVLQNQQTILNDIASLKEELRLVKIRVTQQQ
jgi:hypothetical protein